MPPTLRWVSDPALLRWDRASQGGLSCCPEYSFPGWSADLRRISGCLASPIRPDSDFPASFRVVFVTLRVSRRWVPFLCLVDVLFLRVLRLSLLGWQLSGGKAVTWGLINFWEVALCCAGGRGTHPDGGIAGAKSLCRLSTGHRQVCAVGRRGVGLFCVCWASGW